MTRKYIIENEIAKAQYSSIKECLADNTSETKKFLRSTPCRKAKVPGEFIILRRSKRGLKYILIYCNDYTIEFESGNADTMNDLTIQEIREDFNPEIIEAKELIESCIDRKDLTLREIKKIYKKGVSRARNIEYMPSFNMAKFYKEILPDFLQTKNVRTKVFITSNLRSKIGG